MSFGLLLILLIIPTQTLADIREANDDGTDLNPTSITKTDLLPTPQRNCKCRELSNIRDSVYLISDKTRNSTSPTTHSLPENCFSSNQTMSWEDNLFKKFLTVDEYNILRKAHTEAPFTGEYCHFNQKRDYFCKACGAKLFNSKAKYDSGCGWPSFDRAFRTKKGVNGQGAAVFFREDLSRGRNRTEVLCNNCKSHLGHIFEDGPTETGVRYCINSKALNFKDNRATN